jgi:hypothetical protein
MPMLTRALPYLAILLVAASSTACGGDGAELAALKQETLATFTPPGGRPDFSHESGQEGPPLAKPTNAIVLRSFVYDDLDAATRGWEAAVELARSSGWDMEVEPGFASATKQLETGPAELDIARAEVDDSFTVSIYLEHRYNG